MFWSSRVEVTIYLFFLPGLRSRRFSGGVGIRRTLRVGIVYPIAEVQSNYFLHCTPKLEILTRACWNGTISYETFIETENSCCAQRFPLIDSRYKIVDSQASFTYVKESEILERLESGHFTYGTTTLITTSVGIFPGAAASKCCTSFSGCWRCNANGGSRNSTLSALLVCAGWASILHLLSEMHSTLPLSEILF